MVCCVALLRRLILTMSLCSTASATPGYRVDSFLASVLLLTSDRAIPMQKVYFSHGMRKRRIRIARTFAGRFL